MCLTSVHLFFYGSTLNLNGKIRGTLYAHVICICATFISSWPTQCTQKTAAPFETNEWDRSACNENCSRRKCGWLAEEFVCVKREKQTEIGTKESLSSWGLCSTSGPWRDDHNNDLHASLEMLTSKFRSNVALPMLHFNFALIKPFQC
jgi:hypothetical protein